MNGAGTPSNGAATPVVAEGTKRTKRTSSLMKSAMSLPKVEHSLDEFIARANQTLVDASSWSQADLQAKEEDDKRREQDAQRWKQAEGQLRESEARETALRRQLDGLQGKLAEAEARVAVALSASGSFPQANAATDKALEDMRAQIEAANQRLRASEQKSQELARALEAAKTEAMARPAVAIDPGASIGSSVDASAAEERIKLAEAKAAKALAAARAAAAGLTVSSADLAAIESGLVVTMPPERRTPWIPIMLAFAGGLGIMFLIWKLALSSPTPAKQEAAPATPTQQQGVAPAADQTPAAPAKPTVEPIEEPAAQPATADTQAAKPTVEPIEEPKAEPVTAEPAKAEPAKVEPTPEPAKVEPKPEPAKVEPKVVAKPAATKPAVKPAATKPAVKPATTKPAAKPAIEDPFAAPAPKKPAAKKPAEKPAGGIVDPF